jgi:hypothetical protein
MDLVRPFLDFVRDYICGGDERIFEIENTKNCWMFQYLFSRVQWCTVLTGPKGSLKSEYAGVLQDLWTHTLSRTTTISKITGSKMRLILQNKKFIVVDELPEYDGTKPTRESWNTMKTLVTQPVIEVDDYIFHNYCNYILCTNFGQTALPPDEDEDTRRYFLIEVKKPDDRYKSTLYDIIGERRSERTDVFCKHLLTYYLMEPTALFNPHNFPELKLPTWN